MDDKDILNIFFEEGNKEYAFNLLLRKYSDRLYWHIRKMVGDHDATNDLLQNTWVKVWKFLPTFKGESSIYTWLYRIATNETLTYLKKEKLRNVLSLSSKESSLANKIEADPYFSGDKLQIELHKAILKLPPKQKAVFNLKYFEEMKYEEIVKILGGSVGSLKASYHHAYTKIKEQLEESV